MDFLRHIFRDISSGLLMVAGYAMLFFIAFNGIYIINQLSVAQPDTIVGNYKYKQGINVLLSKKDNNGKDSEEDSKEEDMECLYNELKKANGNIILKVAGNINGESRAYTANVVFSQKEPFNRELKSGEYPSLQDIGKENLAIIGSYLTEYVRTIGGEPYIKVNGINYRVAGIFKDITAGGYDDGLLIYSSDSKAILQDAFDINMRAVVCGDNEACSNLFEKLKTAIGNSTGYAVRNEDSSIDQSINTAVAMTRKYIVLLLFVFCGANSLIVSNLWIRRRQRDIAIRKAYGYNIFNIIGLLAKDMLKLMLMSVILSLAFQSIYGAFVGRGIEIRFVSSLIIYFAMLIAAVMVVTIVINIKLVTRTAPAQAVKGDI